MACIVGTLNTTKMWKMVNLLTPGLNLQLSGSKAIILTLAPKAKVLHARDKQKRRKGKGRREERGVEGGKEEDGGYREGRRRGRMKGGTDNTHMHVRHHIWEKING